MEGKYPRLGWLVWLMITQEGHVLMSTVGAVDNGLSVMVRSQLVLKVVFILGRVYRECRLQKRG